MTSLDSTTESAAAPNGKRRTEFTELLDLLGIADDERVSICSELPGRHFSGTVPINRRESEALACSATYVDHRDVWFGVNPVELPDGYYGRGKDEHVTRCTALFSDIDVRTGGVSDSEIAETVARGISAALGQLPSAVVSTGHGGHPYWLTDPDDPAWTLDTEAKRSDATAVYRRFHRLCSAIAERHGGSVDNVGQLSRILRVPGTFNRKDPDNPIPVNLHIYPFGTGGPLSFREMIDALDAYGVPEMPEDREVLGEIISEPQGWTFGKQTTPYVATMTDRWRTDIPREGVNRHNWLVSQATRLACAHRLGRITEADHDKATQVLAEAFDRLLSDHGDPRGATPNEAGGTLAWGVRKTASFTEERAAEEVGGSSGDEPDDLEDDIQQRMRKLVVEREARNRLAAAEVASLPEPERFIPREFVTDRTPFLVEGLFKGGDDAPSAVLVAQRKAGKSTVADELVYALVTGARFCGQLPTHLPQGWRVVILDTEMSGGDLYDTYTRCRPLLDDGRVTLWKLIGTAGLLDMRDERARRRWDSRIPERSVIVVDCLSPILSAAGITENGDEMAIIIDGLIALARERRSALFVVHHMGKDQDKGARGHSSLEGKFGSLIYLTCSDTMPTESTPRYIKATGRAGIALSRRRITRDEAGHLVMDAGDGRAAAAEASAEQQDRDEAVFRMICLYPARSITALSETQDARLNEWNTAKIRSSLERLESQHRAANIGHGGGHQWVPQWLRDPMIDLDRTAVTAGNVNGVAVEGSTAHEAAVRVCVEAICAFVKRDPAQAGLSDTKMEKALSGRGYPPRKIHVAAYRRWEAACENAGHTITDPALVPSLPTPGWSQGQTVHSWLAE